MLRLFADSTVVYLSVAQQQDASILQQDLGPYVMPHHNLIDPLFLLKKIDLQYHI